MEIVSAERQQARYRRGMDNAASPVALDQATADALGLEAGQRMTKREIGLLVTEKSWSEAVTRAHNNNRYRDAMDEVTERFTPAGAEEPTTLYEQGLAKSSQEDWITAIVNRGVQKYSNAMTDEYAFAKYRGSTPQLVDWMEQVTMPSKVRTNTFDAEAQITANIERVRATALGLNALSRGQDLPGAATGGAVAVQAPTPEVMGMKYEMAFEEFGGVEEYRNVFDPAVREQPPPEWHAKALAKADAFAELGDDLNILQRNWYQRSNAISDSEFLGEATSERSNNNFQDALTGTNLNLVSQKYVDNWAPYRTALVQFDLDAAQPRGPRGTDQNILRSAHVAGLMKNTKYIYYGLVESGEFTPYGAGAIEQMSDWITDIADEWSPF